MKLFEIKELSKDYQLGKTTINALKEVSFSVNEGEFLSIVGPSGCGKTTLLNMLGCIDTPTRGKVFFEGTDIVSYTDNQEAETRLNKMGFIFQSFNLVPVLTVAENIAIPLLLAGEKKAERNARVAELLEMVDLESYKEHKPDELSGGQRQRVAVARALANRPRVVIADEPTANLDSKTGGSVIEAMAELNRKEKVTFIFSTHNEMVRSYANRVIQLKDGEILDDSGEAS